MTYHSDLGDNPDDLNTIWQFFKNGDIEFDPVITDGADQYTISSVQICLSDKLGIYYPQPRCYEYEFGPSADSLTLQSDVETIAFTRIV
jgi:hypothetical protein